jgi:hypothetical protein
VASRPPGSTAPFSLTCNMGRSVPIRPLLPHGLPPSVPKQHRPRVSLTKSNQKHDRAKKSGNHPLRRIRLARKGWQPNGAAVCWVADSRVGVHVLYRN